MRNKKKTYKTSDNNIKSVQTFCFDCADVADCLFPVSGLELAIALEDWAITFDPCAGGAAPGGGIA